MSLSSRAICLTRGWGVQERARATAPLSWQGHSKGGRRLSCAPGLAPVSLQHWTEFPALNCGVLTVNEHLTVGTEHRYLTKHPLTQVFKTKALILLANSPMTEVQGKQRKKKRQRWPLRFIHCKLLYFVQHRVYHPLNHVQSCWKPGYTSVLWLRCSSAFLDARLSYFKHTLDSCYHSSSLKFIAWNTRILLWKRSCLINILSQYSFRMSLENALF